LDPPRTPQKKYRPTFIFVDWMIYPTEVTNDQVITTATEKPCPRFGRYFADVLLMAVDRRFLMQCGMPKRMSA